MRIHLFVSCTHEHSIFIDIYLLWWLFLKHIYECHVVNVGQKSIKMEATHKHRCWFKHICFQILYRNNTKTCNQRQDQNESVNAYLVLFLSIVNNEGCNLVWIVYKYY